MKIEINGKELKASDLTMGDIWNIMDYLSNEGMDWMCNELNKHGTVRLERCMPSLQEEAMMLLYNAEKEDPEAWEQLMVYLAEAHAC